MEKVKYCLQMTNLCLSEFDCFFPDLRCHLQEEGFEPENADV